MKGHDSVRQNLHAPGAARGLGSSASAHRRSQTERLRIPPQVARTMPLAFGHWTAEFRNSARTGLIVYGTFCKLSTIVS
jgi:hypothetical protein